MTMDGTVPAPKRQPAGAKKATAKARPIGKARRRAVAAQTLREDEDYVVAVWPDPSPLTPWWEQVLRGPARPPTT
ncbi:hypothetical protein ACFYVR_00455 [Rhodococcus sp. NPDC003318]|uniref:hypothetical protein n=1 Tax=Rhodococcus sp. NPDC003318 TaxID=3364503 RepID=UPI0036BDCF08